MCSERQLTLGEPVTHSWFSPAGARQCPCTPSITGLQVLKDVGQDTSLPEAVAVGLWQKLSSLQTQDVQHTGRDVIALTSPA